jgi:hypothetical protein
MESPAIQVVNSGVVLLQFFDDGKDGKLVIAEGDRTVPFEIKRVYYITDLENAAAVRGKHAHKKLEQLIFCVHGSFDLALDDGSTRQTISLSSPYYGIRLGPKLWHTMTNFSDDCVILVLANDYYDDGDYIRDYHEFVNLVREGASRSVHG